MISQWVVKDTDGAVTVVEGDSWERSGNGLEFFMNGRSVAHFSRWAHYHETLQNVTGEIRQPITYPPATEKP